MTLKHRLSFSAVNGHGLVNMIYELGYLKRVKDYVEGEVAEKD